MIIQHYTPIIYIITYLPIFIDFLYTARANTHLLCPHDIHIITIIVFMYCYYYMTIIDYFIFEYCYKYLLAYDNKHINMKTYKSCSIMVHLFSSGSLNLIFLA